MWRLYGFDFRIMCREKINRDQIALPIGSWVALRTIAHVAVSKMFD